MTGKSLPIAVAALVLLFSAQLGAAVREGGKDVYFCQGQAVDSIENRNASRQAAIQDFFVQGLTQALGLFLSPAQIASSLPVIQDKIFQQPQRYVDRYEIFSEGSGGGLYRVTGQVAVAVELLQKDLREIGLEAGGETGRGSSAQPAAAPAPPEQGPRPSRQAVRGATVVGREVFWAVSEKWDQHWFLPRGKRDSRGLFALSIAKEARDLDWSLRFSEAGAVTVESDGTVSIPQVVTEAKALAIQTAVVGNVGARRRQDQNNSIEATLRIVDVESGRMQGEIRKTLKMGQPSDREDASELALLVLPQLDSLLHPGGSGEERRARPAEEKTGSPPEAAPDPYRGPSRDPESAPGEAREATEAEVKGPGEWTVRVRSSHPFVVADELQKLIRERVRSVHVKGMEVGAAEVSLRLEGIDGPSLASLQGAQLSSGHMIHVESFSQEARSITLGLAGGDESKPEPAQ